MYRTPTRFLTFFTVVLLCVCVECSIFPTVREVDRHWLVWKLLHRRVYSSREEEVYRKGIFVQNLRYIKGQNRRYNAGLESYKTALNQFADLTNIEFAERFLGTRLQKSSKRKSGRIWQSPTPTDSLPDTVDWRDKNLVTEVKDQVSSTGSREICLSDQGSGC